MKHRRSSRKSRKSKSRNLRKSRKANRRAQTRRQVRRGGSVPAPVNAPGVILSPAEQAKYFLYPQRNDMRYSANMLNSRTPLINTAVKVF